MICMNELQLTVDIYALVITTLTLVNAGAVYMIFYEMFKRFYGAKLKFETPVKNMMTLCGMEVTDEVKHLVPVSEIMVFTFRKAFKHITESLTSEFESKVLRDWFFYALIILTALIVLSLIMGWY